MHNPVINVFRALAMSAVVGCHSPASQPASTPTLEVQTGHAVHFEGKFQGPGKLADYIRVDNHAIYLIDPEFGGQDITYDSAVAVDGVLLHSPGYSSGRNDEQGTPPYFYINGAHVRRIGANWTN